MKKLFVLIGLMAIMVTTALGGSTLYAGDTIAGILDNVQLERHSISGIIEKTVIKPESAMIWVRVSQADEYDVYIVHVNKETIIKDASDNRFDFSSLKSGTKVEAEFNGMVLESFPPQIRADLVTIIN